MSTRRQDKLSHVVLHPEPDADSNKRVEPRPFAKLVRIEIDATVPRARSLPSALRRRAVIAPRWWSYIKKAASRQVHDQRSPRDNANLSVCPRSEAEQHVDVSESAQVSVFDVDEPLYTNVKAPPRKSGVFPADAEQHQLEVIRPRLQVSGFNEAGESRAAPAPLPTNPRADKRCRDRRCRERLRVVRDVHHLGHGLSNRARRAGRHKRQHDNNGREPTSSAGSPERPGRLSVEAKHRRSVSSSSASVARRGGPATGWRPTGLTGAGSQPTGSRPVASRPVAANRFAANRFEVRQSDRVPNKHSIR